MKGIEHYTMMIVAIYVLVQELYHHHHMANIAKHFRGSQGFGIQTGDIERSLKGSSVSSRAVGR